MATTEGVDIPRLMPDLKELGHLLYSLAGAESPDLRFPVASSESMDNHHRHEQVFARKDGRWPRWHALALHFTILPSVLEI